jgi:hypothetical protein
MSTAATAFRRMVGYYSAADTKPGRFVDPRIEGNRIEHVDHGAIESVNCKKK